MTLLLQNCYQITWLLDFVENQVLYDKVLDHAWVIFDSTCPNEAYLNKIRRFIFPVLIKISVQPLPGYTNFTNYSLKDVIWLMIRLGLSLGICPIFELKIDLTFPDLEKGKCKEHCWMFLERRLYIDPY